MIKNVTYSKEVLDLLKQMSSDGLLTKFIIRKEEDNICIRAKNENGIRVEFISQKESFDFNGDLIGFVDGSYSEFYSFFNSFKSPSLKQDVNKLIMKDTEKRTLKFKLSDSDIIKNEFKGVKGLPDPIAKFELKLDQFNTICKMLGLLKTSNDDSMTVNFTFKGKEVNIVVVNGINENSYDVLLPLIGNDELKEEISFPLKSTVFDCSPRLDYIVEVFPSVGAVKFSSKNDKYKLDIFSGIKVN